MGEDPLSDDELLLEIDLAASLFNLKTQNLRDNSIKPQPFVIQVPLVDVFRKLKNVREVDRWQVNFCERLQDATANRDEKAVRAIIHAQAQLGKSVILAQAFPCWLFGHDPLHRFALLTYNITRSQTHAETVINLMQSPEYKDLFPHTSSHLPKVVSKEKFMTNGRRELNDAQPSYNPLGLRTGLVGNGADTVSIDDPYASPEEARSTTIREKIERLWTDIALPRITQYVNVFGMFHRYLHDDFAGFLLKTGTFDYWRYASQADGDYTDINTGRVYPDPLERKLGEYISERFSAEYYEDKKFYPQLWASQFQGRPSAETANFFDVKKIVKLDGDALLQKAAECVHWVRAWDNAATDGGGAFTAGGKFGITPDHDLLITDMQREQVNTAGRYELQKRTAEADGKEVPIMIPNDPGSAGTDTAFTTEQMFATADYICLTKPVTGKKEVRAYNFSQKLNAGKVFAPANAVWLKDYLEELEKFPLGKYKDQVDASADAENYLDKLLRTGTVLKNYAPSRQLVSWDAFAQKFGRKIPKDFKIYVAVQYQSDSSIPSGAVILARASENARLGEAVFLVGCHRQLDGNFEKISAWLEKMLDGIVEKVNGKLPSVTVVLNSEAENQLPVLRRKLKINAVIFSGTPTSGIPEMNWYLKPDAARSHPFNKGEMNTRFYWLIAETQRDKPQNEFGLLSARQEARTWAYADGVPQQFGAPVLNCVRMLLNHFKTSSTALTVYEQFSDHIAIYHPELKTEAISVIASTEERASLEMTRIIVQNEFVRKHEQGAMPANDFAHHLRETDEDEGYFELL